jgi:hypothetical protein
MDPFSIAAGLAAAYGAYKSGKAGSAQEKASKAQGDIAQQQLDLARQVITEGAPLRGAATNNLMARLQGGPSILPPDFSMLRDDANPFRASFGGSRQGLKGTGGGTGRFDPSGAYIMGPGEVGRMGIAGYTGGPMVPGGGAGAMAGPGLGPMPGSGGGGAPPPPPPPGPPAGGMGPGPSIPPPPPPRGGGSNVPNDPNERLRNRLGAPSSQIIPDFRI